MKKQKPEWDKVAEWWDAETGDKGVWHQQNDIDPVVFRVLGNVKNKKILEVGCGNGYFARMLANKGARVTAIDLSQKLIALAEKREKIKPLGIKYCVRDAAHLEDFRNKTFDIVIANMSLIDIARVDRAIKEFGRVLKHKGRFIFSITHPVFSEFYQQWTNIKYKNKKYFARAIARYLTTYAERTVLWASGVRATHYHRSINTYFKYLKEAGFLISDFREIPTKKKVKKATPEHGDVKLRRSRYKTLSEKKMKEFAAKEIPMFLVIEAVRV